jgi:hypothetical protein
MHARDALIDAILPRPAAHLPALAELERGAFWTRFDAVAPLTVRLALAIAAWAVVRCGPWLTGHGRGWEALDEAQRDDVVQRAEAWPGIGDLMEVVKLVACFAYFDDPRVQASFRGERP